ncbi:sushi, nidogen and EGF-like domain-containing protein 1 [Ruditapes philippinarum]|uniref:sushi, nidogen and EGF-like domain-containing protein 1 n=1 Tax=Ruditapes philippinarum TaxID=129788 RepID=UPI00295B0C48|nr:sushi, nidogen and EGF-like domain-containing protein 1 [Ruditapes philippinarum]
MFQNSSPGRRKYVTGIFILMTDGSSSNIHESIVAALRLKNMGITIYTAGVGSGVNVEELQGAATNPSYYFNTISYTSLQSLEGPITMSACEDLDGCICYNGGTCAARIIGYKCECPAIYTGYHCETPICDTIPCRNDGVCMVSGGIWFCHCQPGYTGLICETGMLFRIQ